MFPKCHGELKQSSPSVMKPVSNMTCNFLLSDKYKIRRSFHFRSVLVFSLSISFTRANVEATGSQCNANGNEFDCQEERDKFGI